MGRFIDLSRPITDDEREYLLARSREGEVTVNDRQFGHLEEGQKINAQIQAQEDEQAEEEERKAFDDAVNAAEEDSFPAWIVDKIEPLTVAQLRTALAKRGLEALGEKIELQIRLADFLEEQDKRKANEDVNG